jgi:hypothetical protein
MTLGELIAWAGPTGFFRPFMIAQGKVLFDLTPGEHYFLVFRTFQAAQLIVTLLLFVRLLGVGSFADFTAMAVAVAVLLGIHTFDGTITEAFPVNHFLMIVLMCLAVCNLARSEPRGWKDGLAVAIFLYSAFTIESGLVLFAPILASYVIGWRGSDATRATDRLRVLNTGTGGAPGTVPRPAMAAVRV